jgi:ADP-heptose:LPS heptosyltransferase
MSKLSKTAINGERNILVFRTGQLGDTIVSLPAIHAIRANYPNHRLILLTPTQSNYLVSPLEILGVTKIFSEVIFYSAPTANAISWVQAFWLALKIRRLKPEIFFYLRGVPYSNFRRDQFFFQIICGVGRSYGFEAMAYLHGRRDASGLLLRYPSEVDRLLEIVRAADGAGPVSEAVEFGIPISDRECTQIDAVFSDIGISPEEVLIAFGPGSKMPAKRWPLDRFIEVGRHIIARFPQSRVILLGGLDDFRLGEQITRTLGAKVVNLAGRLTVLESAEFLRRCILYVGNDTGVMHLAAAVGIPCVAIFSTRDHPGLWDPYGRNHVVLRKEPPCAGCLLEVCVDHDTTCLKQIGTDEVLEAVQSILAMKRSKTSVCVE